MFFLYNKINHLKGTIKAIIAFIVAILLGASSALILLNSNDVYAVPIFPSILASLCLCIVMYLNVYIQNGFKFDSFFINNLPELLNVVGLVFCIISAFLLLLELQPFGLIFAITGVLNIIAYLFFLIKRAS
jgi:hypothetical protein